MTFSASYDALGYLCHYGFPTASLGSHLRNATNLALSILMVKIKNNRIALSAINTRMKTKILEYFESSSDLICPDSSNVLPFILPVMTLLGFAIACLAIGMSPALRLVFPVEVVLMLWNRALGTNSHQSIITGSPGQIRTAIASFAGSYPIQLNDGTKISTTIRGY